MNYKAILVILVFLQAYSLLGQNTFHAVIRDAETKEPLTGANAMIEGTTIGASADGEGLVFISNVPNGLQTIVFTYLGYEEHTETYQFPLSSNEVLEILLEAEEGELDEIVIASTRSSRTIEDIPTRIEFIAGEELEEKSNMKAGDIRMLLNESTGIQTQQTSATSANASIRIQGLDGRYTQILKDGFPLYSGAAGGLGLLQTPPLDLKQVEVIKGSASTLYGGGAIAGLVNLISKTPSEERDLRFHLNGSSGKGFDLNAYYGQRFEKVGATVFASHNRNWAYDPSDIGFTAIPKFERYVINPKLFLYFNERSILNIGLNTTIENRLGGDIAVIGGITDSSHRYFEENETKRFSTQFNFDQIINDNSAISVKNSINYFIRGINIPQYSFDGNQLATFTEVSYSNRNDNVEWVTGANFWSDRFNESQIDTFPQRDYNQITVGAFAQNLWKTTSWLNLETGFRVDYVLDHGFAFLPRASVLFKILPNLTSRLGGGFGYKAPTIFTEESERIQYQNVLPIDTDELEKSYGVNLDFNYRTTIADKVTFSVNQMGFFTYIKNPLLLTQQGELYKFRNIDGNTNTKGTETNVKIGYEYFKLFLGYTFTDTRIVQDGISVRNPLTPKHRLNTILMFEIEEKWKAGLEVYYFSRQNLNDGSTGKQYVICGFMVEKLWEKVSIYINFENFTNTRQSKFDDIYTGSITNPVFRDIYAPLDGFLVNGGIKLKL